MYVPVPSQEPCQLCLLSHLKHEAEELKEGVQTHVLVKNREIKQLHKSKKSNQTKTHTDKKWPQNATK